MCVFPCKSSICLISLLRCIVCSFAKYVSVGFSSSKILCRDLMCAPLYLCCLISSSSVCASSISVSFCLPTSFACSICFSNVFSLSRRSLFICRALIIVTVFIAVFSLSHVSRISTVGSGCV